MINSTVYKLSETKQIVGLIRKKEKEDTLLYL